MRRAFPVVGLLEDWDRTGDRVMLHPEGVSVFKVLSVEDDHALIESVIDAPGKFPFSVRVKFLVPAPS